MHGWNLLCGAARLVGRSAFLVVVLSCVSLPTLAREGADRPTIVVFGDSQAQGLARGLQRVLAENPSYRVLNRTHPGAALVHGENEWLEPIERATAREKAEIAVVMFGANDRLDMREGRTTLRFRSEEWRTEYTARIFRILDVLAAAGFKVVWLGNPIARSAKYTADMSYINELYAEATARYRFQFMPLWTVIADDDGRYTAYGKDRTGVTQRLRGDDGIHFTSAGYELIAEKIVGMLSASAVAPNAPDTAANAPPSAVTNGPAPAASAPASPAVNASPSPTANAPAPAASAPANPAMNAPASAVANAPDRGSAAAMTGTPR